MNNIDFVKIKREINTNEKYIGDYIIDVIVILFKVSVFILCIPVIIGFFIPMVIMAHCLYESHKKFLETTKAICPCCGWKGVYSDCIEEYVCYAVHCDMEFYYCPECNMQVEDMTENK